MTRRKSAGSPDVVIIGAGIIGLTIARALAARGDSVIVVDRDSPGRRATWAAGGMLSPLIESADDDPFFRIADRSFDLYPSLIDAVENESGMRVDFRTAGKLQCALDDDGAASLERLAASSRAARYGLRMFTGDEARALEPALSPSVVRALLVERDHCVDNRLLVQALLTSAAHHGAEFHIGSGVDEIAIEDRTAVGVRLVSGERIDAGHVIVAAGAWSSYIDSLPTSLPVRPLRGQMLAVDMRNPENDSSHAPFDRVLGTEACYMIPRSDGRLLIGATVEDVGFHPGPTPAGLAWLIDAARAVVPGVADMPILETWAGYRPGTPDAWPIIGADPEVRSLVYATGHYRNGILLAPVTAEAVVSIVDGTTPQWIEPFGITRFAK